MFFSFIKLTRHWLFSLKYTQTCLYLVKIFSYIVLSLCLVVIGHKVTFSAATVLDYLVLTSIFFLSKSI